MNESLLTFKCVPKVMIFEEIKFEDNLSLLHVTDGMVAMLKAIMQTHGTYWRTWSVCPTVSDITYMSEVESLYMYFGVCNQYCINDMYFTVQTYVYIHTKAHQRLDIVAKFTKYPVSFTMARTSFYPSNYVRSTTDPYTVRHTFWDCV